MGRISDKIVKAIDKASTCRRCGCGPYEYCNTCTASNCTCTPGNHDSQLAGSKPRGSR